MIYGFFDRDHYGPKPAVRVHVRVEGRQQTWEGFIRFIIDTGADVTCIRAMDAILHL
ncbi:MAG: hypothetical protein HYX51_07745 [Chloroflexi bacterium]|nr:hypothetical protein [Chloroflexota bacterium]